MEHTFIELCQTEIQLVSQVVASLQEEQTVLIKGEIYRLEAVVSEKARVLAVLDEQRARRVQWMADHHIDTLNMVHAWLADKREACEIWVALDALIKQAHGLNELNGRFIRERLKTTHDALAVLKPLSDSMIGYRSDGSVPAMSHGGRHWGCV